MEVERRRRSDIGKSKKSYLSPNNHQASPGPTSGAVHRPTQPSDMAAPRLFNAPYRLCLNALRKQQAKSTACHLVPICARRRRDYSQSSTPPKPIPDFAFAFEYVPLSIQLLLE